MRIILRVALRIAHLCVRAVGNGGILDKRLFVWSGLLFFCGLVALVVALAVALVIVLTVALIVVLTVFAVLIHKKYPFSVSIWDIHKLLTGKDIFIRQQRLFFVRQAKFFKSAQAFGSNRLEPFALEIVDHEDYRLRYVLAQIHYSIYGEEGEL